MVHITSIYTVSQKKPDPYYVLKVTSQKRIRQNCGPNSVDTNAR